MRLNTPGQPDGVLRGGVDGQVALEKTDVRFRTVDRLKIEAVWINVRIVEPAGCGKMGVGGGRDVAGDRIW